MRIIDAHVHLGNNPKTKYYTLKELRRDLGEASAQGAVVFAFPEDMYRTIDSEESRVRANEYVLEASKSSRDIYPFYFVWNDYLIPENLDEYLGIKWHRHADEPRYDYEDPRCGRILEKIRDLGLPVLLEEEFEPTLRFIERNPELRVVIPHMGRMNGGYELMDAFFNDPNVYFDTSVASPEAISRVIDNVGVERVIFGSDVSGTRLPFYNFPKVELEKILKLNLDDESLRLVLAENIESLIKRR
ncbi:MAG: amidohydrolase family protein [Candidatus Bathyarchaeia archaeon]